MKLEPYDDIPSLKPFSNAQLCMPNPPTISKSIQADLTTLEELRF